MNTPTLKIEFSFQNQQELHGAARISTGDRVSLCSHRLCYLARRLAAGVPVDLGIATAEAP